MSTYGWLCNTGHGNITHLHSTICWSVNDFFFIMIRGKAFSIFKLKLNLLYYIGKTVLIKIRKKVKILVTKSK